MVFLKYFCKLKQSSEFGAGVVRFFHCFLHKAGVADQFWFFYFFLQQSSYELLVFSYLICRVKSVVWSIWKKVMLAAGCIARQNWRWRSSAVSSFTEVCLWVSLEKNSEYAVWAREEQQRLLVGIPRDQKHASFDKGWWGIVHRLLESWMMLEFRSEIFFSLREEELPFF